MSRAVRRFGHSLSLALAFAALFAVGGGCKCTPTPTPNQVKQAPPGVRVYLVSTVAGALEPCGCVKDMLGGIDHLAAFIAKERASAPQSIVLGAGPTLFADPMLDEKKAAQDGWKAEALARSLDDLGLRAWTPGKNDFAAGAETLAKLTGERMTLLGANLDVQQAKVEAARVYDVGPYRVGVAGVSLPTYKGALPPGVQVRDPKHELESALRELEQKKAQIKIALVAITRGEALRLAEQVPGFHVLLVGKQSDQGDGNDQPTPAVLVGKTLVVQAPNHLQAVASVDFHIEDSRFDFQDGSRTADEERRTSLRLGLAELEGRLKRLADTSADKKALADQYAQKKRELEELSRPSPPTKGSFFTYRLTEVRESLGSDEKAKAHMGEYYRKVNDHNREAFKDWLPKPAAEGQSSYVGIEACTSCHQEERAFWNTTPHAKAYATLANQNKQFNLECASCHLTGYDQPGGSTLTHVEKLTDVQCEVCHGPGSRHVANPTDSKLLQAVPAKTLCAASCHHPPHVPQGWNSDEAWLKIIGKGHGM